MSVETTRQRKRREQRANGGRQPSTVRQIVNRVISTARSGFFGRRSSLQYGSTRDLYDILGYDDLIEFDEFQGKYNRQDIAGKIVDAPARVTWRRSPIVTEEDGKTDTNFVNAWRDLERRLRLHAEMQRADRIAGIGHYSVMLIGVKGDTRLDQPLPGGSGRPDDVIFTSSFHEGRAEIRQFEKDSNNERFGLPTTYRIDLTSEVRQTSTIAIPSLDAEVHWTRLIHIAEDTIEDRVFGRPRLERVYNRLDDLMKVAGGSAEMFWQNVARLWWLNINPDTDVEDETSLDDLETDLQDALHGLRRTIQTQGVDKLEAIGGDAPKPKETFDVLKELIAAAAGIPSRILFGSERGELASSQDEANWLGTISERQTDFAEPVILRPYIDRLIDFKYLPAPSSGAYNVTWPNLFELSESELSSAAANWGRAIKSAAPFEDPSLLVPPHEFRERFLGLPPEAPPAPSEPARDNALRLQQRAGDFPGIDPFWRTVHRVIDGFEPETRLAFLDAMETVRNAIPAGAIQDAIATGEAGRVADLIPLGIFETEFGATAGPLLQSAFTRVADLAAREVSGEIGIAFAFDAADPRILRIVQERTADLVRQVTIETREAIREIVEAGFREGLTPFEQARRIRDQIGLTRFQMRSVQKFRADLIEAGITGPRLEGMVSEFVEAKIAERAAVIARQEPAIAANAGQFQLFKQLERSGLVTNVQKEWIVTPDDRLCPICRPMDGQRQNIDDPFTSSFNGARAIHPPIHIQCRCAVSLVFATA